MIHIRQADKITAVAFEKTVVFGEPVIQSMQRLNLLDCFSCPQIKYDPFVFPFCDRRTFYSRKAKNPSVFVDKAVKHNITITGQAMEKESRAAIMLLGSLFSHIRFSPLLLLQ